MCLERLYRQGFKIKDTQNDLSLSQGNVIINLLGKKVIYRNRIKGRISYLNDVNIRYSCR